MKFLPRRKVRLRRSLVVLLVLASTGTASSAGAGPAFRDHAATARAVAAPAFAADWVAANRGPQPPGAGSLVYDARHRRTVLLVPGAPMQIWVFDGGSRQWSREVAPGTTPTLAGAIAQYDAANGTIVVLGTPTLPDLCDDQVVETWTWDGSTWTQQHPAVSPPPCTGTVPGAMAYDARRHRVVMIATSQFNLISTDSWEWDGSNWVDAGGNGPAGAEIAYDATAGRITSFGGTFFFRGENDFGDTRAWNGSTWTTLSEGGGPNDPARRGDAALTFDGVLGGLVLFGGVEHYFEPPVLSDTWRRVGTHWVRVATAHSPPPMADASFVYDPDHHLGVLTGSKGTWLFEATRAGNGYLLCARDGGVFALGDAHFYGSTGNIHLNQPIVGIARTATRKGYSLAASDGGIFTFGDAHFYGSTGNIHLNQPIVGIAGTPTGRGYWLVARDGGIFTFGDAHFYGSTGNIHLNQPIVAIATTPSGHGYWLVARDGGIFTFGDAHFYGSAGGTHHAQPIVGMAANPIGGGYWLVAADGTVFAYGQSASHGTVASASPIVAIAASPSGGGYWLFAANGGAHAVGDATQHGNAPAGLHAPIVGATTT